MAGRISPGSRETPGRPRRTQEAEIRAAAATFRAVATRAVAEATVGVEATAVAAEAAISRWSLRRRRQPSGRADALIVGLGNPGDRYAGTRHNLGFQIAEELSRRWDLPKPRKRYGALLAEGRMGPGGPRVALLLPQTFMNESGNAAGPVRGELGLPLDHVIVLHDEIDLPFGEVRSKLGGGVAGHNGLKSLNQGLGGKDFWRVRGGVGRPDSTDPEIVSSYVLSRFREPREDVERLIGDAADEAERLVEQIARAQGEEEMD
jgi:PTH1 family peptidyl-tRNA hydrolase